MKKFAATILLAGSVFAISLGLTPHRVQAASSKPMYRLYNQRSGEHFYTASIGESNALIVAGWRYEGIGWNAPTYSKTPVYRLYNQNAGDHHYTTSRGERDALVKSGWKSEGIGWYSDDKKGTPLYRQYNPRAKSGAHNYTTSRAENDQLVRLGWRAEGIGWYGVTSTNSTSSVNQRYKNNSAVEEITPYDDETVYLGVGDTKKLYYSIDPYDAENEPLTWSSSNNSIASVRNGVVTGISNGNATITATASNGVKATWDVVVRNVRILGQELPIDINTYDYDNRIQSTCKVTNVTISKEYFSISDDFSVSMTISGYKSYGKVTGSDSCKIGWKLYDSSDRVVESGTFYSADVALGERFKGEQILSSDLKDGTYTLVLDDVRD